MKLLGEREIKRLAIYFFYDKDGVVDDYIPYMFEDLNKNISELLFVCNGKLTDEGRKKIEKCTSNILVRENTGFDVWAYKDGLESYGWDKLSEFDEVILMNFTMYGPLYPFKEMFDEMNKRDVDFWGITKHHSVNWDAFGTCKYGYIPEHIQSSFIVIRQEMIKSKEYQEFWDTMRPINSYADSVGYYEAIFTKDFNELGFKSDVYVNTDDLEGYTRYPLMMMSYELIKNRKCPVMKRKSFTQYYMDIISDTVGNTTIDAYEYIQNNLDYDVNLIWDNILRLENMADIKNMMHLNYILPQKYLIPKKSSCNVKVALIMHIYYSDLIDYCLNYAKSMPEDADLIITTPIKETCELLKEKVKALKFNEVKIIEIENRGRDVSSLLVGCAPYINNYDYVCFVHDKKTTQIEPYCNGDSFAYKCFENNLASKEFVQNIITTFESNPRIGLLTPPPPNHGNFYQVISNEWFSNYNNTVELAEKLNLKVNISNFKEPIAPLGTMFWFRPQAMKTLFDYGWKYDDFPKEPNGVDGSILHAIERIYGIVVQHEGYYPAWVMSDNFARIEVTNLNYMLREINKTIFAKYYTLSLIDMTEKIKHNFSFCWSREVGTKGLIKKYTPKPLWNFMKKVYYLFKRK